MKKIGLHIRLNKTLLDVVDRAENLAVPIFQCFFIHQLTNQFIQPGEEEIKEFLKRRHYFQQLYLHGSYWINLASYTSGNKILLREITLAKKLEFTHIILHPGSAKRVKDKREGIGVIARNLNRIFKIESDIKVVLENTAHAGLSIGGDLNDFKMLKERLDHPEKLLFCLDTAHAHSYGYDLISSNGQQQFTELVQNTLGLENIALIHLNDTGQLKGSRIDKHELIGSGLLGASLPSFIGRDEFKSIPVVMELPVIDEGKEEEILKMVRSW